MDLFAGTKLQRGKYKILETIGRGGFGYTYLAEHCLVKQKVAIKELFRINYCTRAFLQDKIVWTDTDKEREIKLGFLKEVKTMWKLRQSHIVHVKDVFEENNTIYYVMEYVNGRTLRQIVKEEGCIPQEKAVKYIAQVADGLRYLHRKHRYHLDIKPENIIIDAKGYAYIIDFGASVHTKKNKRTGDDTLTSESSIDQYTRAFAPAEILIFNEACVGSDIYSLGATLYNILSNTLPVDAASRYRGDVHLKSLRGKIDTTLWEIIKKAMEPDSDDRFESMSEFQKKLESLRL